MRRRILFAAAVCFLWIFAGGARFGRMAGYCAAGEEALELYARSAVLMDGGSGRILYGKDAHEPMAMASTTKIMTCILALELGQPDQVCTVSADAAAQPKVRLGMAQGDSFYLKDLLYSLMLESHNDTAVCIAENIAGSVGAFAKLMNQKASELGCSDTYFITPNGLDAEDENGVHHTTAAELARILRYCIRESPKAQEFLEITQTDFYSFASFDGNRSFGCTNHNAFLHMMEGALTGKTGFTSDAGYCYVGALQRDGRLLIVSLLACGWPDNKRYKWSDTRRLMEYGLEQYEERTFTTAGLEIADLPVKNGVRHQVAVEAEELSFTVLMRADEEVTAHVQMPDVLAAPVFRGETVGMAEYRIGGELYAAVPIVTRQSSQEIDLAYCLKTVAESFFF